jgi:hypothetical protein
MNEVRIDFNLIQSRQAELLLANNQYPRASAKAGAVAISGKSNGTPAFAGAQRVLSAGLPMNDVRIDFGLIQSRQAELLLANNQYPRAPAKAGVVATSG